MGKSASIALQAFVLAALAGTVGGPSPAVAPPPRAFVAGGEGQALSILTYNVEGLPWPVRSGRAAAAQAIAERLRLMRTQGVQPHIVVLQEAFGPEQRAIGARAGYRYQALGPGADMPADDAAPTRADRAYIADRPVLRGEGWGKWAGSGLVILSDYPIVATARTTFADHACAGFDCLANKGAMIALVAVPGLGRPLSVVATHLNARAASGVARARNFYAFARQAERLGTFLRANLPAGAPFVIAGDSNIGHDRAREERFGAMLDTLRPTGDALADCLGRSGCAVDRRADAEASKRKHKDLEIYGAGSATALRPVGVDVAFGREPDGTMLSDHIGYSVRYAAERAPARALTIATR